VRTCTRGAGYPNRLMFGIVWLLLAGFFLIVLFGAAAVIHGMGHPARRTHGSAVGLGLPTGPGDLGRPGEAVTFRMPDGTRSDGWVVGGDAADGPTVVISHGFGDSRYGALLWSTLLLPRASQVVVYDLRAHGNHTAKRFTGGLIEAGDLLAIIEQLKERGLTERGVVLFGCSMGANISIEAAAKAEAQRHPIVGLIAEGAFRRWSEPVRGMFYLRRYPPQPFIGLAYLWYRVFHPASMKRYDKTLAASRVSQPVLMLHGAADVLCPMASARAIARAFDDAELVIFDDGRHLDLAQVDPQRYGEAINAYFDRLDS